MSSGIRGFGELLVHEERSDEESSAGDSTADFFVESDREQDSASTEDDTAVVRRHLPSHSTGPSDILSSTSTNLASVVSVDSTYHSSSKTTLSLGM